MKKQNYYYIHKNKNKVNKIQLDRLKQKCECTFFHSCSGKKYVTEQCKFCKRGRPNNLGCTILPIQTRITYDGKIYDI